MSAIGHLWRGHSEAVVMLAVGTVAFGLLYLCFLGIFHADAAERKARLEAAERVEDAERAASENKRRLDEALAAIEELKAATNTAATHVAEAEREKERMCKCADGEKRTREENATR